MVARRRRPPQPPATPAVPLPTVLVDGRVYQLTEGDIRATAADLGLDKDEILVSRDLLDLACGHLCQRLLLGFVRRRPVR